MSKKSNNYLQEIIKEICDSDSPLKYSHTLSTNIANLAAEAVYKHSELKDCVNELCLKCGKYREEHLGMCDGCRWRQHKEAFRDDD